MVGTILSVGQAAKGFLSGEARARRQERRAQRQDRREQRQAARQEVVQRIQQPLTGRASLPAPAVGNNAGASAGTTLAARTPLNFQRMLLPLLGIAGLFLLFQGGKRAIRRRTARRAPVRRAPVRRKRRK